jgi:hypothetical protein
MTTAITATGNFGQPGNPQYFYLGADNGSTAWATVKPGDIVTGSYYVLSSEVARGHSPFLRFWNAAVSAFTDVVSSVQMETLGAWTRMTVTGTAPAGSAFVLLYALIPTFPLNTSETRLISAPQIEAGSVATPYVDGSLGAGYTWEAAENIIANENALVDAGGTGSWVTIGGATKANSTTGVVDGSKSLAVTMPTASAGTNPGVKLQVFTPVIGTTYTFSFYVSGTAPVVSTYAEADGTASLASTVSGTLSGTPQRVVRTFTAKTATTELYVYVAGATTSGQVFYLDAVQLEQKDHATAYAVGATPNATTSRRQFPWAAPGAAVAANEVWRREKLAGGAGIRLAAAVGGNAAWTDYTPGSGVDYEYQAVAVGTNGARAASAWVA